MSEGRLNPLLKMAVLRGVHAAVKLHVNRNGDLNARDDKGRTPLLLAASRGHSEICQLLIDAGADIMSVDNDGYDAISIAIAAGHTEVARFLQSRRLSEQANDASLLQKTILVDQSHTDTFGEYSFGEGVDLSCWEDHEESPPPLPDEECVQFAKSIQRDISAHIPVDIDNDWSDTYIDFPDIPNTRKRIELISDELRLAARSLFVDGQQLGGVSVHQIQLVSNTGFDEDNADLEAHISVALGDLGVVIEEDDYWQWYCTERHNEQDPEEELLDEDIEHNADNAIRFLTELTPSDNGPIHDYAKSISRLPLLSHENEIEIGTTIEHQYETALVAITTSRPALEEIVYLLDVIQQEDRRSAKMVQRTPASRSNCKDESRSKSQIDKSRIANETSDPHAEWNTHTPSDFVTCISDIKMLIHADSQAKSETLLSVLRSLRMTWRFIEQVRDRLRQNDRDPLACTALSGAIAITKAAKRRMTEANLRLVMANAKRRRRSGVPLADLIQAGNIGLLRAVDKYEYRRGFKFSTYATWWINQGIGRFIDDHARTIRIPVHLSRTYNQIKKTIAELELEAGHPVSMADVAARMSMSVESAEKVADAFREVVTLDFDTCDNDCVLTACDSYFDPTTSREELDARLALREKLHEVLDSLVPRQARILRLRYGIDDGEERTLEMVGNLLGVTRERIRQIEMKALSKIRDTPRKNKLLAFVEIKDNA